MSAPHYNKQYSKVHKNNTVNNIVYKCSNTTELIPWYTIIYFHAGDDRQLYTLKVHTL